MMQFVKIRSDDPYNPGSVPFQNWPAQQERFEAWDSGQSEVILKARQLGISWSFGGFALRKAMYEGAVVGIFSVGQREAREQLKRIRYLYDSLPEYLTEKAEFRSDDAEFAGGGKVLCFPSTEQAGISYTFQVVGMDEAGFHPYGAANYAALRPTLSAGGQLIILSTANPQLGQYGFFHDMYQASKEGETGYTSVFMPWDARPGRDGIWLARERAAFQGMPEHFDAYYPSNDIEAFIGKSGLVYPQFTKERYVKTPPFKWDESIRKVAGIDFGGGDPTAVVVLGMDVKNNIHQFGEFYRRGPTSAEDITQFLAHWKGLQRVLCDPSEPVAIETLRSMGFPAVKANNKRQEGLGIASFVLDNDLLTIDASCMESISEFGGYRWSERTDPNSKERFATRTPVDNHADAMDARRYALMELTIALRKKNLLTPYGRKPLARAAV